MKIRNAERIVLRVADLRPNEGQIDGVPANPRYISEADFKALCNSLREDDLTGILQMKVYDNAGVWVVLDGNMRLRALNDVGVQEVECIVVPQGTPAKVLRKIVALSNSTFGEWDMDMLANEWDEQELSDWGIDPEMFANPEQKTPTETKEAQEDDFDEEKDKVETVCKKGDIWLLGQHRLMCGDSTDADAVGLLMQGEKADMCFTDPPYGVSYTGGIQFKADGSVETNNRQMIANDDIDIYVKVFEVLKDFVDGPCYVWFADKKAASLYVAAEKYGEIHALIIWVKNGGYGALNANYKQKHEPCLYWKPKGANLNFIGATTETTIWEINKDGKNEYHPTQKPVALPAKAISNHKCSIVLDLFGGSGSTLIACEQLGRKCYMMELDPHYCDVIIARWEKLTGQKATRL